MDIFKLIKYKLHLSRTEPTAFPGLCQQSYQWPHLITIKSSPWSTSVWASRTLRQRFAWKRLTEYTKGKHLWEVGSARGHCCHNWDLHSPPRNPVPLPKHLPYCHVTFWNQMPTGDPISHFSSDIFMHFFLSIEIKEERTYESNLNKHLSRRSMSGMQNKDFANKRADNQGPAGCFMTTWSTSWSAHTPSLGLSCLPRMLMPALKYLFILVPLFHFHSLCANNKVPKIGTI